MFYILGGITFLLLSTCPKTLGDLVVRFVLQYILLVWIIVPCFLATNVDIIGENIMFDALVVRGGYELELIGFFVSVVFYLIANRYFYVGEHFEFLSRGMGGDVGKISKLFLMVSAGLILTSVAYSFIFPSSYEEVNLISSTAGVGGKFGLPIIEPLLLSYIIGFLIFNSVPKDRFWFLAFASIFLYSVAKVMEGSRFALIYPFIPSFIYFILLRGRFFAIKIILLIVLLLSPLWTYVIISLAETRVSSSFNFFDQNFSELFDLLTIHVYLKFSSVINSMALSELAQEPSVMQGLSALVGVPLSVIPRFIWPGKPISGSIDGLEAGLPYRIAADVLGYPDYGNVGLSPFITSSWLLGDVGFVFAVVVFSLNLLLASYLMTRAAKGEIFFGGLGLYMLGMPHFSSCWVDFSAGLSILFRSIIFTGVGVLIYKNYRYKNYIID